MFFIVESITTFLWKRGYQRQRIWGIIWWITNQILQNSWSAYYGHPHRNHHVHNHQNMLFMNNLHHHTVHQPPSHVHPHHHHHHSHRNHHNNNNAHSSQQTTNRNTATTTINGYETFQCATYSNINHHIWYFSMFLII